MHRRKVARWRLPAATKGDSVNPVTARSDVAWAGAPPRFSVVIPTYQRRDVVVESVRRLGAQVGPSFDVVVVVDGSRDGTANALRELDLPFPLAVVEQPNNGAAAARNLGAQAASAEIILFLDDDMRAAPDLLAAHEEHYRAGADAVMGHVPIDPESPPSLLTLGDDDWAEQRRERLAAGASLTLSDLLTGQLSVRRDVFSELGGFDEDFTRGGTFGGEDTDFGHRLLAGGYKVVFAPAAVSWQHYVVQPAAYLRQWHQAGAADVRYVRKHPLEGDRIFQAHRPHSRINRLVWRPLARAPIVSTAVAAGTRQVTLALADRRPNDARVRRLFFKVRDLEYWRGVHRAGGMPVPRPVRVLCYHSVSDLAGAAVVEQYGVPPARFQTQLKLLRRFGFRFVSLREVVGNVHGRSGLPRRPIFITFDDCFTDLLEAAVPILVAEAVPAAAFAVAGLRGGTNQWDIPLGAPPLKLLDTAGLLTLEKIGVEVGVHGMTHRPLRGLTDNDLATEVEGARAALEECGLKPSALAYPHGEHDEQVRACVAQAGFQVAFSVDPGFAHPRIEDRFALPRIEILRRDGSGIRLLLKVLLAGRPSAFWSGQRSKVSRVIESKVRRYASHDLSGLFGRDKHLTTTRRTADAHWRPQAAPTENWRRIAVVGASATGKTDLAKDVSGALGLPHVELDRLRWPSGHRTADDLAFSAALDTALASDAWVMDGAEDSLPVRSAWKRADAIVWLDHSRAGVAIRMLLDTSWVRGTGTGRWSYFLYIARKSGKSWQQATHLRRELPHLLEGLGYEGVQMVRLQSVRGTRSWRDRLGQKYPTAEPTH
jgi:glycosyltransferase involved in cell wall biosynthesis